MKLYNADENYKLYHGNMLDMAEVIEPNSIDAIVTDPPYELNFMNKGWDNSGIAFQKETWKKCYDALKSGGHMLVFGGSRTFHRIACAIEDAGFEIRDTIMWIYGCYSADTQVLTNEGWKYFYDLNKREYVLQWDKNTNKLSWVKPLNYFEYDIDDELKLFENRHISQLVTKNHKIAVSIKKRRKEYGDYELIDADSIKKSWNLKFPCAGEFDGNIHEGDAYIIGWWLTDAWKHKDGKACIFSQSKFETLDKLRNWFDSHNITYREYIKKSNNPKHKDEHTFYVTGKIADKLLSQYPNRELSWEMLNWDKKSRELLLEGLMDGDGTYRKDEFAKTFWSKKQERCDIVQAICLSLNYRSCLNYKDNEISGVNFNTAHNSTETQTKHRKPNVKYRGKVYCLQTETGAFVVRRNGKSFISGNSGFPKSMDISKQIDKKGGNDYSKQFAIDLKQARESRNLTMKYCDNKYCNSSTNWSWYEGRKDGCRVPDYKTYLEIIKEFPELDKYKEIIKEAERKVIGIKKGVGCFNNDEHYTVGGTKANDIDITIPSTDLAKRWDGWGTQLKPSYEPIIVCRKPCEGSIVDNVMRYGVGGINIDECRVKLNGEKQPTGSGNACKNDTEQVWGFIGNGGNKTSELGRFPANTILTYDESDYDEVCGGFPQSKGACSQNNYSNGHIYRGQSLQESNTSLRGYREWYNDDGSASRYFKNCQYTEKDGDIWLNMFVNNVENNLEIENINKEFIAQNNVEDLLLKLKSHYAKYVENQLNTVEISIVQDIAEILIWDFKIETSQVIQDFIGNYKKCIQFQNLVQFVEKMDNIDTTQITQNLLKLFGYVKVVITNYIRGNLKYEQKRYIYSPKASRRDRDEGLEEFEDKKGIRSNAPRESEEIKTKPRKNIHPTIKPTSLMQYLVRLVTPKGGTVLDPFNGSGSTGKACMYENADRNANYKYIGIELTEEYLPISKARIEFAEKTPIMEYKDEIKIKDTLENKKEVPATIFDLI